VRTNSVIALLRGVLARGRTPRRRGPAYAAAAVFCVARAAAFFGPSLSSGDASEFEAGRGADRDVSSDRTIIYVDEEATRLRRVAQERLVPAAFRYSAETTRSALAAFSGFASLSRDHFSKRSSAETYALAVQSEFPGIFPREVLDSLHRAPNRAQLVDAAESAFRLLMNAGIFAIPASGLDGFNPDLVEILRVAAGRNERERVSVSAAPTPARAESASMVPPVGVCPPIPWSICASPTI